MSQSDTAGVSSTPATEGVDHNGIVVGRWKAGIFGCCDDAIPNGLMSFICPGVSIAHICKRLGIGNYLLVLFLLTMLYVAAIAAVAISSVILYVIALVLVLFFVELVARLRRRVRFTFSLPGSAFEDWFYAIFCGCCAIAQMATHVESYRPGSCDFRPRNTLEGYAFD